MAHILSIFRPVAECGLDYHVHVAEISNTASERTLRDYTHWKQDVNQQLLGEISKYDMAEEVKKHDIVCLCLDEVKIEVGQRRMQVDRLS